LGELKRTGVSKLDSVCVVGCGFWPYMVQMLAVDFQAKVSGYDNNRFAVQHAQRYLARYTTSNKVTILFGDGSEIDNTTTRAYNDLYYEGDISQLWYWDNRTLTSAEVLKNYNDTKSRYN